MYYFAAGHDVLIADLLIFFLTNSISFNIFYFKLIGNLRIHIRKTWQYRLSKLYSYTTDTIRRQKDRGEAKEDTPSSQISLSLSLSLSLSPVLVV